MMEVIEHLDQNRLLSVCSVVFDYAAPKIVIITTPNREYNIIYGTNLRHPDHKFEWSRAEFQNWSTQTAVQYGYSHTITGIGQQDTQYGCPTQMSVFVKYELHKTGVDA